MACKEVADLKCVPLGRVWHFIGVIVYAVQLLGSLTVLEIHTWRSARSEKRLQSNGLWSPIYKQTGKNAQKSSATAHEVQRLLLRLEGSTV